MKKTLFFIFLISSSLLNSQTVVNIEVNEKVELLRIIYNLGIINNQRNKDLRPVPSPYQQDVKNHFKKFRKHPAVKKLKKVWLGDYGFPYLGLDLENDYSIPENLSPELEKWFQYNSEENTRAVLGLVKDFAESSNFKAFFEAHQKDYEAMLQPMVEHFDTTTWVKEVADFFGGKPPKKISIYFDPLNNVGNKEITSKNKAEMIIGLGNIGEVDKKNASKPTQFVPDQFTQRIFYHEATHFYTTKMTYAAVEKLRAKKNLFLSEEDWGEEVKDILWLNWMDETIVRGIVAYLFKIYEGEAKGLEELSYQEGLEYTDEVYHLMEEYSKNRDGYPNIESFHSKIIELMLNLE